MCSLLEGVGVEQPVDLAGLFRFTARVYRANLGVLSAVAALSTVVAVAAGLVGRAVSHEAFFTTASSGVYSVSDGEGSHLHASWPMVASHLLGVVALAWASATFVSLLLGHLRDARRPSLGLQTLLSGLPYWLWVAAFSVLFDIVDRLLHLAASVTSPASPPMLFVPLTLTVVIGILFIFYVQEIVDARRAGTAVLHDSWLLMHRVGFWRVLGNRFLFGICLLPIVVVQVLALSVHGVPGSAVSQLLEGLVVAPLNSAFVTIMYLLASGRHGQVEGVLGPVDPSPIAKQEG